MHVSIHQSAANMAIDEGFHGRNILSMVPEQVVGTGVNAEILPDAHALNKRVVPVKVDDWILQVPGGYAVAGKGADMVCVNSLPVSLFVTPE